MDIQLNYQEAGTGTPFLLLHGNGEDHTYFRHQIEYFRTRYRFFFQAEDGIRDTYM